MSELCRFSGITIHIYYNDHAPPHFHAKYGQYEAQISVATLTILNGNLPVAQRRVVMRWARMRQAELHDAWHCAQNSLPPGKIAPLR